MASVDSSGGSALRRGATMDNLLHESRPSTISRIFYHWPSACMCGAFLVCVICSIVTFSVFELNEDAGREYLVWDDIRVERQDAYNKMLEEYEDENNKNGDPLDVQSEEISRWSVWLIYESKGKNLLTADSLDAIHTFEAKFQNVKNYDNVCYRAIKQDDSDGDEEESSGSERACSVDSTSASGYFTPGWDESEVDTKVSSILADGDTYDVAKTFFDKSWKSSNTSAKWARSLIKFGAPLDVDGDRYKYYLDDPKPQNDYMLEFAIDAEEFVDDYSSSEFNVYYFNDLWYNDAVSKLVLTDFYFIVLSILFVYFYMMFHTRSALIPTVGMLQVIFAFPFAYFLYRYIFQVTFFNMMSLLSIFVILGIAADDMFVFMDAWKQALEHQLLTDNLERRIIWTYRRAAHAMFVTTLTTFCAFAATGISEIMPIAAFGIFSACFILCNYILVITNFPAIVVMREKFFIWWRLRKEAKEDALAESAEADEEANKNDEIVAGGATGVAAAGVIVDGNKNGKERKSSNHSHDSNLPIVIDGDEDPSRSDKGGRIIAKKASIDSHEPRRRMSSGAGFNRSRTKAKALDMSKMDRFFYTTYSQNLKKGRFVILGVFFVWAILAIIFASQFNPPEEQESWLPADHELNDSLDAMDENFSKGENDGAQIIRVIWGVDGMDKSGVSDRWDPEDYGEVDWDKDFDVAPIDNQNDMIQFCNDLEAVTDDDLVRDGNVTCFWTTFATFLSDKYDLTLPVAEENFLDYLIEYTEDAEYSDLEVSSKRIGLINGKLRYIVYKIIGGDFEPAIGMEPRYDDWEKMVDTYNKNAHDGVNNSFHTSQFWQWFVSEKAFIRNALQGIAIAGSISFVVLIASTLNIVLSIYAITCIAGIVVSVMGFMYLKGWDFGTAESIAVVILVGFSVDYTVHLCHAYMESHYPGKEDRTRESLAKMGNSILGGAVTTFGDGCMLFFCTLIFFTKFAWIVTVTIFFAVVWSLIFLPALLFTVGPQHDTGNLKVYFNQTKQWMQERQKKKREGQKAP